MKIASPGSERSLPGGATSFTGTVRRDPLFDMPAPGAIAGSIVTFEPGARTHWHTHPLGQVLIIASGAGWVQTWGGERRDVRVGDVVTFDPEEKHWHGATAETAMSHYAITESLDRKAVDWMEPVDDDQYGGR